MIKRNLKNRLQSKKTFFEFLHAWHNNPSSSQFAFPMIPTASNSHWLIHDFIQQFLYQFHLSEKDALRHSLFMEKTSTELLFMLTIYELRCSARQSAESAMNAGDKGYQTLPRERIQRVSHLNFIMSQDDSSWLQRTSLTASVQTARSKKAKAKKFLFYLSMKKARTKALSLSSARLACKLAELRVTLLISFWDVHPLTRAS